MEPVHCYLVTTYLEGDLHEYALDASQSVISVDEVLYWKEVVDSEGHYGPKLKELLCLQTDEVIVATRQIDRIEVVRGSKDDAKGY